MKLPPHIIGLVVALLPLASLAQPRSAEELVSAARKAIQEKNSGELDALFYTAGMSDSDKEMAKFGLQGFFQGAEIERISLLPLPPHYRSTYVLQGKKVEQTYPPAGIMEVKFKPNTNGSSSSSVAYAVIKQGYFLLSSKSTDLGWSGPPDKSLGFMVIGMGQNKVQIKAKWNASGIDQEEDFEEPSGGFWGQYFEKVTIISTQEDTDVTLTITENGKETFKSERLKGKGTVGYKKKS
jgi:hypothetical protein